MLSAPSNKKKKFHELPKDPPPETVSFADFQSLAQYVGGLSGAFNQLRHAILEDGSSKLIAKLCDTCESIPDLPLFGPPMALPPTEVFLDDPVTPVPSSSTKSTPFSSTLVCQPSVTTSHVIDHSLIAKETMTLLEKSCRAVVERMPDDKTPDQDSKDFLFFTNLAKNNQLPVPSKVHRHPCSSRFRPIKLQFSNKGDRDSFMKGYNKIRLSEPTITAIDTKPRIRRDLTLAELQTLRTSRKFVYDENMKAGTSKYIMHDINYKLNDKPRPFQ